MRLEDFDYDLPEELIAQEALPDRGASRLLVAERKTEDPPADARFRDLPAYLDEGDLVVVNRSRVVPARLFLRRASGGRVEMLFLRSRDDGSFDAWLRPLRRMKPGEILAAEDGETEMQFIEAVGEREARLAVVGGEPTHRVLDRIGHVPLPPYIRRGDRPDDRDRYQTVFAVERGSVAAPTAGLHFDADLVASLEERGITVASLILHVGPGTFEPLEKGQVEDNALHAESFHIDAGLIASVQSARARGGHVVAVGTTVARALETAAREGWLDGSPEDRGGDTDLFVYPGHAFQAVDRLVTNFHLPRSSLLLLVCAFGGTQRVLRLYRTAVERRYRFYSYGDAMLISRGSS